MNSTTAWIGTLCLCSILSSTALQPAHAQQGRTSSSRSSSGGVSVSTTDGETIVTVDGREVFRGPTKGSVTTTSRNDDGVEYNAVLEGDRILWESSSNDAARTGTTRSTRRSAAGGSGGPGAGIDHDAFIAEHEANFDRMVREMHEQARQGNGTRTTRSQSGFSRSGGHSSSGGTARSSAGSTARAGGSIGGFTSGSSGGSAGGYSSGSGTGGSRGGGFSSGNGIGTGNNGGLTLGDPLPNGLLPGAPTTGGRAGGAGGQDTLGTTRRPEARAGAVNPGKPAARPTPGAAKPKREPEAVTLKLIEGSSVVVYRGKEHSVGPTHGRLTADAWVKDDKDYAIVREDDRIIWENVPGAARQMPQPDAE